MFSSSTLRIRNAAGAKGLACSVSAMAELKKGMIEFSFFLVAIC
jgi:hypothetical protein